MTDTPRKFGPVRLDPSIYARLDRYLQENIEDRSITQRSTVEAALDRYLPSYE